MPEPRADDSRKRRYAWDRMDKEPEKAYGYFARYRDAGRARRVGLIADQVGISREYGWRLSRTWNWARRAEAWDRELDQTFAEAVADRRRQAATHVMGITQFARNRIAQRLQELSFDSMTADQLLRWLEAIVKIEREVLGQPQKVEVTGSDGGAVRLQVETMTDQERKAYAERLIIEARSRFQLDQAALPAMLRSGQHDGLTDGGSDGGSGSDLEHVVRGPNGSRPGS